MNNAGPASFQGPARPDNYPRRCVGYASRIVKTIITALAASATFVGCAKVNPLDFDECGYCEHTEITFQITSLTKAAGEVFDKSSVFSVYACHTSSDSRQDTPASTNEAFIPGKTAGWQNNAWRLSETYHWPKAGGSLNFYCWTLNRTHLQFHPNSTAEVSVGDATGVRLENFDISLDGDLDFMVAPAALNKSLKTCALGTSASVPAHFRHQLAKLKVTARTRKDYSGSKEFRVSSVTLKDVARTGSYRQGSSESGEWKEMNIWTSGEHYDAVYGDYGGDPIELRFEKTELPGLRTLYIPQSFEDGIGTVVIGYAVIDLYSGIVEQVSESIPLRSIIPRFVNGRCYTLDINISLEEVFWDPSIAEWTAEEREVSL